MVGFGIAWASNRWAPYHGCCVVSARAVWGSYGHHQHDDWIRMILQTPSLAMYFVILGDDPTKGDQLCGHPVAAGRYSHVTIPVRPGSRRCG